jgi:DNA invertase Pin-like site-specific DNA recombinase
MNKYIIAKYIRLSIDDGTSKSLSISNQHLILDGRIKELIKELNIENPTILDFVDNGYTGTNMNRPAMSELLAMARDKKINCIIVKDFSRFSRSAIESGYYIEQIFPPGGIRFISGTDGFDSSNFTNTTGGIEVAFKFLMNEYYSIDLSKKIKSAKYAKMRSGEAVAARAVYGYRKNQNGKWIKDPKTAKTVERIFKMALSGLTAAEIKKQLFEDKIPSPSGNAEWSKSSIRRTLTNEQYLGTYIAGKQRRRAVCSAQNIRTHKSEWIIIPNHHEPIIDKEIFNAINPLSPYEPQA